MSKKWSLAIILPLVLWFMAGCSLHYHEPAQYSQASAEDGGGDWVGYWDLAAQWIMAVGAFLLFWLTRRTLVHAEQAARDALAETKRSNENYIRNERGMLAFAENQLAADVPKRTIDFTYRNIGNGPLTIVNLAMMLEEVPTTSGKTFSKKKGAKTFINVAAGGYFTSWTHDNLIASMKGLGYPLEEEMVERFRTGTYNWRIAIEIRYRIPVGALYLNRITLFLKHPSEQG